MFIGDTSSFMVVLSIVMLVSGGVDLDDLGAILNQCDER